MCVRIHNDTNDMIFSANIPPNISQFVTKQFNVHLHTGNSGSATDFLLFLYFCSYHRDGRKEGTAG